MQSGRLRVARRAASVGDGHLQPPPIAQRQIPTTTRPDRVDGVELDHPQLGRSRKPVVKADTLVGIARVIEQPRDLFLVDRRALMRMPITQVPAPDAVEDMAGLARLKLDSGRNPRRATKGATYTSGLSLGLSPEGESEAEN